MAEPLEECPNCGEVGLTPEDEVMTHERYRQCRNDDCRVRLYTPYPEFFGGSRE